MSFQSLSFLLFLAATALACTAVGRRKPWAGRLLLMIACLVFCLWAGPAGVLVLCAGVLITALTVQRLAGDGSHRRRVLMLACGYHIAVLVLFKYSGFLTGGAAGPDWAPIGLSFFTFQQLWLLKESYTREYVPVQGDDLILYAFFFPSLTSGPILRPSAFFPQLRSEKFLHPDGQDVAAALYAISLGMVKKVLLADSLGTVVSNGWAMADSLGAPGAWIVILAYTLQLYLDFSGYCDIAAGCARLLGIRLPVNFNSPYRALSVGEFWKRWHITLTTFLRECLYFPLGGSRKGNGRTYLNILIVFLVSGFWHGAGWTFIVWGLLHGLAQVIERAWGSGRERLPRTVRWAVTFLFINLAWVFFRAPNLSAAWTMLSSAVSGGLGLSLEALTVGVLDSEVTAISTLLPALTKMMPGLVLAALLGTSLVVSLWPRNIIQKMEDFQPKPAGAVLCGVLLVWAILSFSSGATFIYSNF